MTDNRRILELALKGLEAERQRIDDEMSEIHRQLGGRTTSAALATPQTQRSSQNAGQTGGNLTPAGRRKLSELMRRRWAAKRKAGTTSASQSSQAAKKKSSGGNLTAAGRKKLSDLMRRRWAEKRKAAARAGR